MANESKSGHEGSHHIVPAELLTKILLVLFALTVLTVVTSRLHLGPFAGMVAFSIAGVKAYLVMTIFMGLKYEVQSNRIIFALGFLGLAVLYIFCALDIYTRVFVQNTL
jgi:cytochrome c oxidase subunit IV